MKPLILGRLGACEEAPAQGVCVAAEKRAEALAQHADWEALCVIPNQLQVPQPSSHKSLR